MEFILKSFSYFTYNFLCLFLFYLALVLLNVHPSPAIHRLATIVKRLELLPGVTTLFRDRRRSILGTFYLFSSSTFFNSVE